MAFDSEAACVSLNAGRRKDNEWRNLWWLANDLASEVSRLPDENPAH
jgi:hypothetical protein